MANMLGGGPWYMVVRSRRCMAIVYQDNLYLSQLFVTTNNDHSGVTYVYQVNSQVLDYTTHSVKGGLGKECTQTV